MVVIHVAQYGGHLLQGQDRAAIYVVVRDLQTAVGEAEALLQSRDNMARQLLLRYVYGIDAALAEAVSRYLALLSAAVFLNGQNERARRDGQRQHAGALNH